MKPEELREMTLEELEQKEHEFKRKLFNLRFQKATGELDNTAEMKKARQDIARVLTIAQGKRKAMKK